MINQQAFNGITQMLACRFWLNTFQLSSSEVPVSKYKLRCQMRKSTETWETMETMEMEKTQVVDELEQEVSYTMINTTNTMTGSTCTCEREREGGRGARKSQETCYDFPLNSDLMPNRDFCSWPPLGDREIDGTGSSGSGGA